MTQTPAAPPPALPKASREVLVRYLFARPAFLGLIHLALIWHFEHQRAPFRWWDVKASQRHLDMLVIDGILSKVGPGLYTVADYDTLVAAFNDYNSELQKYRVREAARPAATSTSLAPPPLPPGFPRDLFSEVVGYQSIKNKLRLAIGARVPFHVLLHGPPGTAKSVFMLGLKTIPGAVYYLGNTMSPPGIRRLFLDDKPPFLIIDEIDKMPEKAQDMLLGAMSEGIATVLQYGENRIERLNIRVFAAANVKERLTPALLSRFDKIQLPEYSPEEFREVAYRHLTKIGVAPQIAQVVAEGVSLKSKDIRDAVRIGNVAPNVDWARQLVDELGTESRV